MRRWLTAAGLAAVLAVPGLTGCTAETPSRGATGAEAHRAGNESSYQLLRSDGGIALPPPATLEEGAQEATAVVLATVAGVEKTRTIPTDSESDHVFNAGVQLEVEEVLHGRLAPTAPDPVVEFLLTDESRLTTLRSSLPQGRSIWFLQWSGENRVDPTQPTSDLDKRFYGLVSMQGLLAQGSTSVVSVLEDPEQDDALLAGTMAADARQYATLSDAATSIRGAAQNVRP